MRTAADVQRYWTRPVIRTIEPFIVMNLDTGEYTRKHPEQTSDVNQISDAASDDDWTTKLREEDWATLSGFFKSIEILRPYIDYLDFTVAGDTRRVWIMDAAQGTSEGEARGIAFHAPAQSLMSAVRLGYFDAILIGNLMTAELRNMTLYPHFTRIVAKLAGASGVRTSEAWRQFRRRYFRRNPIGYPEWHLSEKLAMATDVARAWAERLHIERPLKILYRRYLGDPVRY